MTNEELAAWAVREARARGYDAAAQLHELRLEDGEPARIVAAAVRDGTHDYDCVLSNQEARLAVMLALEARETESEALGGQWLILMQARYMLRDMANKHPGCGYDKAALGVEAAFDVLSNKATTQ